MQAEERFMRRALELAARGLGRTSPNPAVGAVVVRDGEIVGEGYHQRAGEPHAEPIALAAAGELARGADIYVSLEPCCHFGRTPPCTDAIIAAGIARVFYACGDPDARCAGAGEAELQNAGLTVSAGPLSAEARKLNEAYFKHKRTGKPFVTLKLACTLDGMIATSTGDSHWVTGAQARQRVHEWRNESDAVMVGIGTVLRDNPALTCRLDSGPRRDPLRIVIDANADTPSTAEVLLRGEAKCLIAVSEGAPEERVASLEAAGADILTIPAGRAATRAARGSNLDFAVLLRALGDRGIMSVLCEGGAGLAGTILHAGAVDKLRFFYAPKLVGRSGLSAVGDLGIQSMADAMLFDISHTEIIGDDLLVESYRRLPH